MRCTLYARDYGQQGLRNIHIQTLASGNSHCVGREQSEVNKAIYLFMPAEFCFIYTAVWKVLMQRVRGQCGL